MTGVQTCALPIYFVNDLTLVDVRFRNYSPAERSSLGTQLTVEREVAHTKFVHRAAPRDLAPTSNR